MERKKRTWRANSRKTKKRAAVEQKLWMLRKDLGLCARCGLAKEQAGFEYCFTCSDSIPGGAGSRREVLNVDNRCIGCDSPWKDGQTDRLCKVCMESAEFSGVDWGCHYQCGRVREWPHQSCTVHKNESRDAKRKLIATRREAGSCLGCGQPKQVTDVSYCARCYFKEYAKKYLGSATRWAELQNKFDGQAQRCPYSGTQLVPGVNMELDHRTPKARGGTDDLTNLQFVRSDVNICKNDKTHEEFIAFIKELHTSLLG